MERDDSVVTRENSPLQQVPGEPDAFSGDPEVHSITDAAAAHSEDMRDRMIKYAVAMGIRMVCIVLIFVVDGWFKIIAIAGAVFLPVDCGGNSQTATTKAEDHSESLLDYVAVPEIERSSEPEGTSCGRRRQYSKANWWKTKNRKNHVAPARALQAMPEIPATNGRAS